MWPLKSKKRKPQRKSESKAPGENKEERAAAEPAPELFVVTDTLDLHGFFPEQIPPLVNDFIENAKKLGLHRLRIVHGKGKSRLKWEVHRILKEHPEVEFYRDASPETGGWGATVVLLKKAEKGK